MKRLISSAEIIDFLKQNSLYDSDNNIANVADHVSNLENSTEHSVNFIKKTSYDLKLVQGRIIVVPRDFKGSSNEKTIIYSTNPQLAVACLLNEFFLKKDVATVSKTACIHKSVELGENVEIGEHVIIGKNCIVGDNTTIYPNCVIHPNTIIGNNVTLYSGVKIGQSGFGYIKDLDGSHLNFPHIGKVIICNNVEIGANACVDRGSLSNTSIGENTKIDNLCHIAHNVKIGTNCLIAANAIVSGSTVIGDNVYVGPSASIIDGITINDNVVIGIGAIVRKDIQAGFTVVPFGSFEKKSYAKLMNFLNKILKQ